jgi:aspartyl-tRNA(Asn)/glutamyl-tRNA(Gln) amidotransferase subunit A
MTADDLAGLDAETIVRLVKAKEVSPVETTEAAIGAMERLDPLLHAFSVPAIDQARATARILEARLMDGEDIGSLAGVPVGIKDLILTKGLRTTFGSHLYADFVPTEDDVAVARLRAAGAVILGKTNAAEFGYGGFGHNPLFPTTRNPWNLDLTPGGSSAGSAAAVAAGIVPLALGSDGGGSVRLPAAFTGIVGIKPTMGRIPVWPGCRDETLPGVSGWESIEHYGPLARTVADAALFLAAVAGPDPRDRHSLPDEGVGWRAAAAADLAKTVRIAWVPRWAGLPIAREVLALTTSAVERFVRAHGLPIEETASPIGDLIDADRAIVALETDLSGLRKLAAGREHLLSPPLRALLQREWSATAFTDAITTRKAAFNAMAKFMDKFDLILTPTAPLPPFAIDRDGPGLIDGAAVADDAWTPALYPANLTGQPAASVPAGWTKDGLPVGLQMIARRLDDRLLLTAAAAFERALPWSGSHPPVSVWSNPATAHRARAQAALSSSA